ncbi:MAG: hypothetical protein KDI13_08660 [Alphaproteobacteria bacterium]|nr:hypothetical protein [Alphaproteobacteria bacterium]
MAAPSFAIDYTAKDDGESDGGASYSYYNKLDTPKTSTTVKKSSKKDKSLNKLEAPGCSGQEEAFLLKYDNVLQKHYDRYQDEVLDTPVNEDLDDDRHALNRMKKISEELSAFMNSEEYEKLKEIHKKCGTEMPRSSYVQNLSIF